MIGPILVCCLLFRFQIYFGASWFGRCSPDYLVPALVFFSLHYPKNQNYLLFFLLGLLIDCFSVCPFGIHATLYLFLGYLFYVFKDSIYHDHLGAQALCVMCLGIGLYLGSFLLFLYTDLPKPAQFFSVLLQKSFWNFLFSLPILALLEYSKGWFVAQKTSFS